jgi:hypothetical protein
VNSTSRFIIALQEARKHLIDGMLEMPSSDFPSYRQLVGRLMGLKEAIEIIKENSKEGDE